MMLSSSSRLSLSNGIPGRRYSILPRLFGPKWIRFGRGFCRMDQFSTNYVLAILSPGIKVLFCDHQVDRWALMFVTINIFHYISRFCCADQFSTNYINNLKHWCCSLTIKLSECQRLWQLISVIINVCDYQYFWPPINVFSINKVLALSNPRVALWLSSGVTINAIFVTINVFPQMF